MHRLYRFIEWRGQRFFYSFPTRIVLQTLARYCSKQCATSIVYIVLSLSSGVYSYADSCTIMFKTMCNEHRFHRFIESRGQSDFYRSLPACIVLQSASPGQNNRPGTFWLFNESHVFSHIGTAKSLHLEKRLSLLLRKGVYEVLDTSLHRLRVNTRFYRVFWNDDSLLIFFT